MPHTAGRTRGNDVAGFQSTDARDVVHQFAQVPSHQIKAAVLHDCAIETGGQHHGFRVGNFIACHQPRTKGAAGIEVLARCDAVLLVVAQ